MCDYFTVNHFCISRDVLTLHDAAICYLFNRDDGTAELEQTTQSDPAYFRVIVWIFLMLKSKMVSVQWIVVNSIMSDELLNCLVNHIKIFTQ